MGAHFESLDDGVDVAPLDHRCTQVGFNSVSVQVCVKKTPLFGCHGCCHNDDMIGDDGSLLGRIFKAKGLVFQVGQIQ